MVWLFYYWAITGLLMFLWFWYDMSTDSEEAEDCIADVTWNTGIKREYVKPMLSAFVLLLGFIILPYEIIRRVFGWEEE